MSGKLTLNNQERDQEKVYLLHVVHKCQGSLISGFTVMSKWPLNLYHDFIVKLVRNINAMFHQINSILLGAKEQTKNFSVTII